MTSLVFVFAPLLPVSRVAAAADTCTWVGLGGDNNWSTAANWTGCDNGTVPESGDSLVFNASGTAQLASVNDFVGYSFVSISATTANYIISGNSFTLTGTTPLQFDAATIISNDLTFSGMDITIVPSGSAEVTLSGAVTITTPGSFTVAGSGSVYFSGDVSGAIAGDMMAETGGRIALENGTSTYTATRVGPSAGGTFDCLSATCFGNSANEIYINGGTLYANSPNSYTNNISTGPVSADNSIIHTSMSVTFSGNLTIEDDLLIEQQGGGPNTLAFSGSSVTFVGSPVFEVTGTSATDSIVTVSGPISGSGSITASNVELMLSGASTYTGTTTLNTGSIVQVQHETALGDTTGDTTVSSGSTLLLPTTMTLAENLNIEGSGLTGREGAIELFAGGDTTISGSINLLNDATIANISTTSEFALSGVISGTGNLTLASNANTAEFRITGSSSNTYAGGTTILGSRVMLDKDNNVLAIPGNLTITAETGNDALAWTLAEQQIADSAVVAINNAGTNHAALRVDLPHIEIIGGLSGDGDVMIDGERLVIEHSADYTFSGTIYGPGVINKQGTGTLTLSGAFGDNGGYPSVEIHEGTILANPVDSSFAQSTWSVGGGNIGGSGSIGSATMGGTGSFAPGNSPGCLDVTGDLIFDATNSFLVEIGGTTKCTDYDSSAVSGTATLANASLDVSQLNNFVPTPNDAFTILSAGTVSGTFASLADGATVTTSQGVSYTINYSATAVTLTYQPTTIAATSAPNTGLPKQSLFMSVAALFIGVGLIRSSRKIAAARIYRAR